MRVARFTVNDTISFGIVEGEPGAERVHQLAGDPLATKIRATGATYPLAAVRLLAPVIPRSKVIGVARNYRDPASPTGAVVQDGAPPAPELDDAAASPVSVRPPAAWAQPAPAQASPAQASRAEPAPALHLFMAPNTAVVGPGDPIVLPTWTREAVEEAELAIVIGRLAKDVPADRADEVIFGYTIANDVTARDVQRAEPQWARAKGFDTAVPLGPWIETDLPAGDTPVRAWVNGELRQDGSTLDLIHPIPALVAQISAAFTLLPGDVIMTGTPAGASRIEAGDTVACEAAGIGTLTNPVVRR